MNRLLKTLLASVMLIGMPMTVQAQSSPSSQPSPTPLAKAHAHNDYWHTRPLEDALDHGFTSVEADVWLEDGQLLVGHDKEELQSGKTLESLYLKPLKKAIKANGGSVNPGYKHDFLLWIDIKSDNLATYQAVDKQLRRYQDTLTRFGPNGVKKGAITVIISGNRPREYMQNQRIRYAGYDGRMSDLGTEASPDFMPVISDNWKNHFTWQGNGPMPKHEREKLRQIISTAHANGQMVRFWATPDQPTAEREAVWEELLQADIDLINTDDLAGLQRFLLKNDPHPSEPNIKR